MQKLVWLLVILLTVFTVTPVNATDWFVSTEVGNAASPSTGDVPFTNSFMCNIRHIKKIGLIVNVNV